MVRISPRKPCTRFVRRYLTPDIDSVKHLTLSCEPWPAEAKTAFQRAVGIWVALLQSPVRIIDACWDADEPDPKTVLAAAYSNDDRNFPGAVFMDMWYSYALANALRGDSAWVTADEDISITFYGVHPWYFGTDGNMPADQYDFVTTVNLRQYGAISMAA
jgi:hypothetical protein